MGHISSETEAAWSQQHAAAVNVQLDRLKASVVFRHSPRQQRLLSYIVEATLAGKAEALKGYTLGVEVFDRGTDFDPGINPIVRVEAGRLRSKLLEFYAGDGVSDPVIIALPKGAYAARIGFRSQSRVVGIGQATDFETTRVGARPSLAVLPLINMSSDPEQEYFVDGITDDLITDLSKLSGLFVVSRHSSFAYKAATISLAEISRKLNVDYVLEGSVRRMTSTVRINAQLVDAKAGNVVWAQRYDRSLSDFPTVQDDVAQKIVASLTLNVTELEHVRIGHEGTSIPEAHDALLRGLQQFWLYTPNSNSAAAAFFRNALDTDPEYAAAHAWLARSLLFDYTMRWSDADASTLEEARHHAKMAVSQDSLLPLAYAVRCWAELWSRNQQGAIASGHRAVCLDPNNADSRLFLSSALSASLRGEEALRQINVGMCLNPHPSAFFFWARGQTLMVLGRYAEALADFREGLRLNRFFIPNLIYSIWACMTLGKIEDARGYRKEIIELTGSRQVSLRTIWLESTVLNAFENAIADAGLTVSSNDQ